MGISEKRKPLKNDAVSIASRSGNNKKLRADDSARPKPGKVEADLVDRGFKEETDINKYLEILAICSELYDAVTIMRHMHMSRELRAELANSWSLGMRSPEERARRERKALHVPQPFEQRFTERSVRAGNASNIDSFICF